MYGEREAVMGYALCVVIDLQSGIFVARLVSELIFLATISDFVRHHFAHVQIRGNDADFFFQ